MSRLPRAGIEARSPFRQSYFLGEGLLTPKSSQSNLKLQSSILKLGMIDRGFVHVATPTFDLYVYRQYSKQGGPKGNRPTPQTSTCNYVYLLESSDRGVVPETVPSPRRNTESYSKPYSYARDKSYIKTNKGDIREPPPPLPLRYKAFHTTTFLLAGDL